MSTVEVYAGRENGELLGWVAATRASMDTPVVSFEVGRWDRGNTTSIVRVDLCVCEMVSSWGHYKALQAWGVTIEVLRLIPSFIERKGQQ